MRVLLFAMLGAAAIASAPRQEQPQTFRTNTDVVQVDVSVLDRNRVPVQGLTVDDFTVLEDGKPRPIVAFAPISVGQR